MKIIAGLGNPGPKYETTRHNAGFLAVDRLVDEWRASPAADAFDARLWVASVAGEKVLLVQPQTFMNASGECLGPLVRFYKCRPEDLIVIYDELDLKPLELRLKVGGGSGGHNGIKSIEQHLGAAGFLRVRIGIGHPNKGVHPSAQKNYARSVVDYVLQPFTDDELRDLDRLLDDTRKSIEMMVAGDVLKAMTVFNQVKPVKES